MSLLSRATTLLAMTVTVVAITAVWLARQAGANAAFPTYCATSSSPYHAVAGQAMFAQHNITVRRYAKTGLSSMFVATAPISSALPAPIFAGSVNSHGTIRSMVASSRALVGVNGDFFHINTDRLAAGVMVGPGGHVVKGTSRWQSAAITRTDGRVVAGSVKVDVVLYHGAAKYVGSTLNDPAGMQANGLAVFNGQWGRPTQPLATHGGWREYVVNSRGVVVATHTAATRTAIPVGGYIVEASGSSAVHLQVNGWRANAHVQLRSYARSSVPGGVYAAEGAGKRLVHNGAADYSACGYDSPTTRTVVGMSGSSTTFMLTMGRGRGVTVRELDATLRDFHVTEAVMFDGGGSAEMGTRAARLTTPLYDVERGIPSAWGLVPR